MNRSRHRDQRLARASIAWCQYVPFKPVQEMAHRLGLTAKASCEAIGVSKSAWYSAGKTGKISKTAALAFETLVRRQSRDATQWALLKLNHGTAEVKYLDEPQRIRIGGKDFLLIEERKS